MIEKILSDGRPGAGAAALDVAIRLGLAHGGWCAEDETIPDRYRLERVTGANPSAIVESAVGAADGTLYFLHGEARSIGSEKAKKAALRLDKPFLLVDTAHESAFSASRRIALWIAENRIRVLYVSGQAKPPEEPTSGRVAGILEATLFLTMMETGVTSPLPSMVQQTRRAHQEPPPETLPAALDHLERSLSLKDKATIANMAAEELVSLHFTVGDYINKHFNLFSTNSGLLRDCRRQTGREDLTAKDAAAVIIRFLWEQLRSTCRLRLVK